MKKKVEKKEQKTTKENEFLSLADNCYESRDYTRAAEWYRKAAEQGDAKAQYRLGHLYEGKISGGLAANHSESIFWYQKAAEQGYFFAQDKLGNIYEERQDYSKALFWYLKASERGPSPKFSLGRMYENGYGVKQDYSEAVSWYRKAAEQGDTNAQGSLGRLYLNGYDIELNESTAVYWFFEAAKQGHAIAQYNLGWMFENGYGVVQNDGAARYWYGEAIKQGNTDAKICKDRMSRSGRLGNTLSGIPYSPDDPIQYAPTHPLRRPPKPEVTSASLESETEENDDNTGMVGFGLLIVYGILTFFLLHGALAIVVAWIAGIIVFGTTGGILEHVLEVKTQIPYIVLFCLLTPPVIYYGRTYLGVVEHVNEKYIVATETLNVHNQYPANKNNISGILSRNDTVEVKYVENKWGSIEYKGNTGYVKMKSLKLLDNDPESKKKKRKGGLLKRILFGDTQFFYIPDKRLKYYFIFNEPPSIT